MPGDDTRLTAVLGELADLGRRISDRAAELAGLMGHQRETDSPRLADGLADVRNSVADLAAAAAVVTAATERAVDGAAADPGARRSETRRAKPVATAKPRTGRSSTSTARSPRRRSAPSEGGRRLRPMMPALVSGVVNLAVILGLALIFVAAEAKPRPVAITLGAAEEPVVDEMSPVELVASDAAATEEEPAADPLAEPDPLEADPAVVSDVSLDDVAFTDEPADAVPVMVATGDVVAPVGGGDGAAAAATGGRTGKGSGGGAAAATFFGRAGQGRSVCFVCDNSNSYKNGGFHTVLHEVARAVESLRPDQSFFVVFFSDSAYPMFHPQRVTELQPASAENKRRLQTWLATVEMCGGGQGIEEAVRIVGSLDSDIVYFLSDGEHAPSVVDRVSSADFGGAVVHTFGMQQGVLDRRTGRVDPERLRRQQDADRNLLAIATAHGGTFTPVMVPPQAAALERFRPITKNRSPGPVWGTRL